MNEARQISEGLQKLGGAGKYEIFSGTCSSVDEGELVMDVTPDVDEETMIPNVRLRAITDAVDGFIVVPEEGSDVIIGSIYGSGYYFLLQASKVKKVIVKIGNADVLVMNDEVHAKVGDTVHKMTASAHQIDTGNESMKKLMNDLLQAIMDATYTNGAGTTFVANNLATFQQIKQRIPNLLS